MDVIEDLFARRIGLGQTLHMVDELTTVHCFLGICMDAARIRQLALRRDRPLLSGNAGLM
jgi:hypothetical protein